MPTENEHWNGFSATNASQMEAKLAYIGLNRQTPCPQLMRAWAGLSRSTKGVVGGSFTRDTRIVLGHGSDRPSYVAANSSRNCRRRNAGIAGLADNGRYFQFTSPTSGSLILNPDGTFTYTPHADFAGTDSFSYKASDGALESNSATVIIR